VGGSGPRKAPQWDLWGGEWGSSPSLSKKKEGGLKRERKVAIVRRDIHSQEDAQGPGELLQRKEKAGRLATVSTPWFRSDPIIYRGMDQGKKTGLPGGKKKDPGRERKRPMLFEKPKDRGKERRHARAEKFLCLLKGEK